MIINYAEFSHSLGQKPTFRGHTRVALNGHTVPRTGRGRILVYQF